MKRLYPLPGTPLPATRVYSFLDLHGLKFYSPSAGRGKIIKERAIGASRFSHATAERSLTLQFQGLSGLLRNSHLTALKHAGVAHECSGAFLENSPSTRRPWKIVSDSSAQDVQTFLIFTRPARSSPLLGLTTSSGARYHPLGSARAKFNLFPAAPN